MSSSLRQRGQEWLEGLLDLSRLPASVKVTDTENAQPDRPSYWLTINESQLTPRQIQTLIGPDGSALDAIQYLANSILNLGQDQEQQAAYTIELDGYRLRRQAELQTLATHAAEQARVTGQEIELKSLSAAERRQIHSLLQECEDLETYSRGQEPDRRLIVRLRS